MYFGATVENVDILKVVGRGGKWAEFCTSKYSGAINAEGIGTSVWVYNKGHKLLQKTRFTALHRILNNVCMFPFPSHHSAPIVDYGLLCVKGT